MQVIQGRSFSDLHDLGTGSFSDLDLYKCDFSSCSLSMRAARPDLRSRVTDVTIRKCRASGCFIGTAIVERVLIEDLKTGRALTIAGTAFSQVTLRGRIGRTMIEPYLKLVRRPPTAADLYIVAENERFYTSIDWAMDISEAQFDDLSVEGIPASRIRIDPETQVILRRPFLLAINWSDLGLPPLASEIVKIFLRDGLEERLWVAPRFHRKLYEESISAIKILRTAGLS